ncbi:MAG: hypothetical protein GY801_24610 [bacterium]|nr:hypothetical protein [bacterium]
MRYFNTSGPCDPEKHYTVRREALLVKGREIVAQGRYFTIFAPRQAGKTTYFQLLLEQLKHSHTYTPVWISFENLKLYSREEFYEDISLQLYQGLAEHGIEIPNPIHTASEFSKVFTDLTSHETAIVLFIDEFEGIPECVLSEVMHTFRKIYHRKRYYNLHSLILVGVSTMSDLILSSASPFNVVDELHLPYFTEPETRELIQQYVNESKQVFEESVIKALYENTCGQPGLVGGVCQHLVESVATDRNAAITLDDFLVTLNHFIKERRDKNILNVVQKAKEKRDFMLRLLFSDTPIEFLVDHEDIDYLSVHGVIDNVDGYVDVPIPLYRKRLITAFRPPVNGEVDYYQSVRDTLHAYITPQGLDIKTLLGHYRQYIRRRGFKAFDTDHLKEGAWHYSLDGFLNFFIEQLGGHTFIETPTGRGRTDILVVYKHCTDIIETKVFTTDLYFQKGKGQLAEYLASENLDEGYYVVFSNKHTYDEQLDLGEEIQGKRIHTFIICTQFERPTDLPIPEELRRR